MAGNEGEESQESIAAIASSTVAVGGDVESVHPKPQAADPQSNDKGEKGSIFSYWQETSVTEGHSAPLSPQMMAGATTTKGSGASSTPAVVQHHGEKWSPATEIQRGGVKKFSQMFGTGAQPSSVVTSGEVVSRKASRRDVVIKSGCHPNR